MAANKRRLSSSPNVNQPAKKRTLATLLPRTKTTAKNILKIKSGKLKAIQKTPPASTPPKATPAATPVTATPSTSSPITMSKPSLIVKIKFKVKKESKPVEPVAVIDSDADSDSDADDIDEDVTHPYWKAKTIYDPVTGLNTRIHWDHRVRTARAKEILAEFEKRGFTNVKQEAEIHWTERKSQNVVLVLLDEDHGSHLIQDFSKRPYWKVLRRVFPEGVIRPRDLPEEDLLHIYTQYGIARQFMVFDLDFMPGVTVQDIYKSLILHFDPTQMPKMFDSTQLPTFFKCERLPIIIEDYEFKKFDQMHVEFQKMFGGSNATSLAKFMLSKNAKMYNNWMAMRRDYGLGVKKVWDKESSWAYLQMHKARDWSKDAKVPVMFNLKPIDWNPKGPSRASLDDEDLDPLDPGTKLTIEEELEAAFGDDEVDPLEKSFADSAYGSASPEGKGKM
ncbi:hypothetical protein BDZ45DRAFT_747701 [Acephala macrosclerotiorum]|nr:hypothetical protein BDZ45DRAFT_747701 [Acephala macrosclerotiorum]